MTRKKTTGRIHPGEYCLPGDRTAAQRAFFQAIRRQAPEVLLSLRDQVLPEYRRCGDEGVVGTSLFLALYSLAWDWAVGHRLVVGDRLLPMEQTCKDLPADAREEIRQAAQESPELTFFFPMAFITILETLQEWCDNPQTCGRDWVLPYRPYPIGPMSPLLKVVAWVDAFDLSDLFTPPPQTASVSFPFECPDLNLLLETRSESNNRILAAVKKALDQRNDQFDNLMREFGIPRAAVKASVDHFDWLALYQVAGKSYSKIAEGSSNKPHPQTVIDGVRDAAKLVIGPCWKDWLRRSQRGRPKRS